MFRSNKPKIADFRADYANHTDFCDLFRADTKRLYVLAFLLTANHTEKVSEARIRALWKLSELAGLIPRGDELPSLRLRAPIGARGR